MTRDYPSHIVQLYPKDAPALFVMGYQYMTCGHKEAAEKQFTAALKLNPGDTVSRQMLDMLGVMPPPKSSPPPAAKQAPAVPLESLVGSWKATRGNATFGLTLGKDKSFIWSYTQGGKKSEMKGAFAVDGDAIALKPDAGGVMVANITLQAGLLQNLMRPCSKRCFCG